jgi:TRAP-type C4-dicarboxylate transport system permease small subunit
MRKFYEAFLKALETFTALLAVAMFLVVIVGVFFRYILDSSLSWYDEFAEFILVWLTMFGSVVALARGKHIGFEAIADLFPAKLRRATESFSALCVLAFSIVMLVSGWFLVKAMAQETCCSIPSVPMDLIYSVMPITGGLMVIVCLVQIADLLSGGPKAPTKGMEEGQ